MKPDIREELEAAVRSGQRLPFRHTTLETVAEGRRRRRRRAVFAAGGSSLVAAVTIGALVAGIGAWRTPSGNSSDVLGQPGPDWPSGHKVPMDLEPLSPAQAQEALEECYTEGDPPGRLDVAYAWRIAVPPWLDWKLPYDAALVALDDAEGRIWTCVDDATSDNGLPTGAQPVEILGGGGGTHCTSSRFEWDDGLIAAVSDEVDRVEIRFGSDSRPGPWWVSRPHDGYLFVGYWFNLPRNTDETYRVEARAYDIDGDLIESDDLTERIDAVLTPQMIQRCAAPLV